MMLVVVKDGEEIRILYLHRKVSIARFMWAGSMTLLHGGLWLQSMCFAEAA